jgi:hypothetical protein
MFPPKLLWGKQSHVREMNSKVFLEIHTFNPQLGK